MATIAEFNSGFPGISTRIPMENGFISEVLAEHGYNTYCVGKWHLTPGEECNLAAFKGRWPLGRGFERFYGFLGGETNAWYPDLIHDNHQIDPPATPEDGYHASADFSDRAIQFIRDAKVVDPDKPFFLYFSSNCGHAPHLVPTEWADKYKGKFDLGYEAIRADILARQKELGLLPADTELSPINPHGEPARTGPDGQPWPLLDTVLPWDSLTDDERRLFARMAEVFAGYVAYTDHEIGRLIDYLEQSGQLDNTIIVMVSDNGASGEGGPTGTFNEWRFFNGLPSPTDLNLEHIDELGTPASYNHYNTGWAWAFDTPFPYWKRWAGYEGGVADMMVVSWPAKITPSKDIRHQYVHAVDIVPTVYELLGIEPPAVLKGHVQSPVEGESFAAALTDADRPRKGHAVLRDARAAFDLPPGLARMLVAPADLRLGQVPGRRVGAVPPRVRPRAGQEPRRRRPGPAAIPEGPLVLLRGHLQGSSSRRPHRARAGPRRTAAPARPSATATSTSPTAPTCPRMPRCRSTDARTRLRRASTSIRPTPRASCSRTAAWRAVTASTSRTSGCATPSTGSALVSRTIVADRDITAGRHVFTADFAMTGPSTDPSMPGFAGVLTLYVDDDQVGEGEIVTQPGAFCLVGDGLCVGRDSASPVSPEYTAPFRFTGGTIDKVVIDVSGDRFVDHEAQVMGWFIKD